MEILRKQPLKSYLDDRLRIFFLGVGYAFSRVHNHTNFLIIKGNDHVLVDFGAKGPQALVDVAGWKVTDIRAALPTHCHADHIGGFEELGITSRYFSVPSLGLPKPRMILTEEFQRILWDCSLRGGMEWNESLDAYGKPAVAKEANGHKVLEGEGRKLNFSDYFEPARPRWMQMQPREKYEINIGSIHLELFRTNHIPEQSPDWESSFWSCGVRVDGRVFISGDTRFDRALVDEYADSEHFFHDCQLNKGAVHAFYGDLATLDPEIKKRMHLIHYGDDWREFDAVADGFAGFAEQGVQYLF